MVNDIDRRKVVLSGVTAAVGLFSGCGGYTVKKTHKMQQLESNLENKKKRISELKKKINKSETEVSSLKTKVTSLEDKVSKKKQKVDQLERKVDQLEEDVRTAKVKEVLYLYANGIAEYDKGDTNWSNASSSYKKKDYADAASRLGAAFGHYNAASDTFSLAKERAQDYGFNQVVSDIEAAQQKSSISKTVANEYGQATEHYARGEMDAGDKDYEDGNSAYKKVDDYTIVDLDKLERTLGVTIDV